MSIHHEHPFLPPEDERSPLRRFRGRAVLPVSVWTSPGERPVGWTVSSFVVADGAPAEVLGLLDAESDLADVLREGSAFAVSLLGWEQRGLADAFAGVAPAPGGPFRIGAWRATDWGPVPDPVPAWLGVRVVDTSGRAGWSQIVRGTVEHVGVGPEPADGLLAYARGRYRAVGSGGSGASA